MNVPNEIVAALVGALVIGIGWLIKQLSGMDNRLTRMETAMSIRWNLNVPSITPTKPNE